MSPIRPAARGRSAPAPRTVATEAPGEAAPDRLGVQRRREGLEVGIEFVEVPAQPGDDGRALGDEILAVVDEDLKLAQLGSVFGAREVGFAEGGAAMARASSGSVLPMVRADLRVPTISRVRPVGRAPPGRAGSAPEAQTRFARPRGRSAAPRRPRADEPGRAVVRRPRLSRQLLEKLAAGVVHRRCGVGVFVGVDADRDHCATGLGCLSVRTGGGHNRGLTRAGSYQVTPSFLGRGGRHDPMGQPSKGGGICGQPGAPRTLDE
jgi:hypothetical protein